MMPLTVTVIMIMIVMMVMLMVSVNVMIMMTAVLHLLDSEDFYLHMGSVYSAAFSLLRLDVKPRHSHGVKPFYEFGTASRRLPEGPEVPAGPAALGPVRLWAAEEPARFGIGCIGSRAMAGRLSPEEMKGIHAVDGPSLYDELRARGLDPDGVAACRRQPGDGAQ